MPELYVKYSIIITVCVIVTGVHSFDRTHRYRSRARHILVPYNGRPTTTRGTTVTSMDPDTTTLSVLQLPSTFTPLITELAPIGTTTQTLLPGSSISTSPRLSSLATSTRSQTVHSRRRGLLTPDVYDGSQWDVNQQRLDASQPPTPTPRIPLGFTHRRNRFRIRQRHRNQNQGQGQLETRYQQRQNFNQGQGQRNADHRTQAGPGQITTPFYSKMSAFDYLASRGRQTFVQNPNTRQNREFGRAMSEGMCEAFGKHYVSISIGGKCV